MSNAEKSSNEVRPEEQELPAEALEEVAGGISGEYVIEIGPPPFFPEVDRV